MSTTVVSGAPMQPAYAPAPTVINTSSGVGSAGYSNNLAVVDFCVVFLSVCCTLGIIAGGILLIIGGIAGSGALVGVGIALIVVGVILLIGMCLCRPHWTASVGGAGPVLV